MAKAPAKAAAAAPEPATVETDDLEGLTRTECAILCSKEGCVITGGPFCGHPRKGGLQAALAAKPEVVERYARARKMIAHQAVER